MSKTSVKTTVEWNTIPWRKLERKVFKLQKRIYRARKRGDVKTVRRLQKLLMKSWSAKCISVRRVTQDNSGKKTAGVDGIKSLTPKQRLALQALVKMALEPEWEANFEPNSYGFRPGRSCHDAMEAIFNAIRYKAKFVLDADIAQCFDRINHKALLEKLKTSPTIRRQVRAWLRAGVMDGKELFPTFEGTPQGGVLSPLLANLALHGLDSSVKKAVGKGIKAQKALTVVRYADDFVILHEDIAVIQRCQQIVVEWLSGMGLELKPSKTRLAHTLYKYEAQAPGFDFLGFTVRQFPVGKFQSGKNSHGTTLGFKTIIKPSSKKLKIHYEQIVSIINAHKSAPQAALIGKLNPLIRGWASYYSTVVSSEAYAEQDSLMYQKLKAWANRRHPNKSSKWVANKYWQSIGDENWVFATSTTREKPLRLLSHQQTSIVRHVKVKGEASPYNGDWIYWSSRMGKHPEVHLRVATLLKKQKGKCAHCELFFKDGDLMDIDHRIPKSKGGRDSYENLQLLHRHCHDVKSAFDDKAEGMRDKRQVIEEPCAGKLASTVLQTSRVGDNPA